jgi:hypothetical protein
MDPVLQGAWGDGPTECGCQMSRRSRTITAVGCSVGLHLAAFLFAVSVIEGTAKLVPAHDGASRGNIWLNLIGESVSPHHPASHQADAIPRRRLSEKARSVPAVIPTGSAAASQVSQGREERLADAATQPMEGMALPLSTGLSAPGRRQPFTPPQERAAQSQGVDEVYRRQWETDQSAYQMLLRQEAIQQFVGQWTAQLRQALENIEQVTCRLDEPTMCEPALPIEAQEMLNKGLAQWLSLNSQRVPYRLIKVNGRLFFDEGVPTHEEDHPQPSAG